MASVFSTILFIFNKYTETSGKARLPMWNLQAVLLGVEEKKYWKVVVGLAAKTN